MFNGQGERDPCASNNIRPTYESQGHAGDAATPAVPSLEGHTGQAPTEECRQSVSGLDQPHFRATGEVITGINKKKLRTENWRQRRALQQAQTKPTLWTDYTGDALLPQGADDKSRPAHRNSMCPAGLALHHPAAETLLNWAEFGCPTQTGKPWSISEMEEAIARGPHQSALTPEALEHFAAEIKEKVLSKQARVVEWDAIKDNPPTELKISPIVAIPHKSKAYRSILDLSFRLRLKNGGFRVAVNDTTVKTAPGGAIDQIGECLSRIIHAFAAADAKIFMAKWDIKDGFWRMDCREGKEWNFAYVLPQPEGEPIRLVIPTSLQMGWVESISVFLRGHRNGTGHRKDVH